MASEVPSPPLDCDIVLPPPAESLYSLPRSKPTVYSTTFNTLIELLPIFQVRYINDNRATVKFMRRLAKKHSPLELDLGRIDPNEVATLFCTAIRDVKQICKDQVRKGFVLLNFIPNILYTGQILYLL